MQQVDVFSLRVLCRKTRLWAVGCEPQDIMSGNKGLRYCLKFLSTYMQVLHFREKMSLGFPVTNVVAWNIAFKDICLFVDKQQSRKNDSPRHHHGRTSDLNRKYPFSAVMDDNLLYRDAIGISAPCPPWVGQACYLMCMFTDRLESLAVHLHLPRRVDRHVNNRYPRAWRTHEITFKTVMDQQLYISWWD